MASVLGVLALVAVPIVLGAVSSSATPTTGSISGTVTDTNGVPVPGATVTGAYSPSTGVVTTAVTGTTGVPVTKATAPGPAPTTIAGTVVGTVPYVPPVPITAITDLRGRYTLTGVGPGTHPVYVRPPAGSPYAAQPYTAGAPPQPYASSAPVYVVAGEDTPGIDVVLPPGGSITGTVTNTASEPVIAASACAQSTSSGWQTCSNLDGEGRYRFDAIPTGPYKVSFNANYQNPPPPGGPYLGQYFDGQPNFATATELSLGAGQLLAGVNARLEQACTVFGSGCTKITNATGCVTATAVAPLTAELRSCSNASSLQWTDTDGHDVVGNPVTLTFSGPGPWTVTASSNFGSTLYTDTITVAFGAPPSKPGPPLGVTATPGAGTASVSWIAPANDGNSPVTSVTVTASSGQTCTWTSGPRSCTVSGLPNGVPVTFTATATNAIGTSGPSAASPPVTPAARPGPPTAIVAVAGNGNALVAWAPPPATPGAALVGFVVVASPGGQTCSATVGSACSVDGLTNGVPTTFTVRGVNTVGVGDPSTPSATVTPTGPPSAPLAVTGQPGNGQVQVSWQSPEVGGGSAITDYTVSALPGPGTCSTAGALTCTVSGLTNGSPYTFTVVATNAAGKSPVSGTSAAVWPGAPSSPTAATATAGKLSANVSWTAPSSPGNSPISSYHVDASPQGPTCTVAGLSCVVTGLTEGTAYTFRVTAVNAQGPGPVSASSNEVTPWGGSGYHPVVPARILDSRGPTGGWGGKLSSATPRDLQVTGLGGPSSVPGTASAVVLNVTATDASAGSFITAWPSGSPQPNASNLNFGVGQTIPNLVTVKVGAGGKVRFANAVGQVSVIADVVGYYDDGTGPGDLFTPLAPQRLLDSRTTNGGWNGRLATGAPRDLVVRQPGNAGGVPATATAVIANITVTGGDHGSFLSVWPSGVAKPNASNLNFGVGQTISNLAIVRIGANGALRFDNAVGSVDVIVDVVGYFDPSAGSRFHALAPSRFLDSRIGLGTYGPLVAGETRGIYLGQSGISPAPTNATALVSNLTVTNGTLPSFVTVFPGDGGFTPNASNINFAAGQTIPNLVTVKLSANYYPSFSITNQQGSVDIIADAVGYYAAT